MKRNRQRIVIDTNIIISFLLKKDSVPGKVVQSVLNDKTPLLSDEVEKELFRRVLDPKFDLYASREDRKEFFKLFVLRSETVITTTRITDCRDPKDNKFLDLAIDGKADYIVSGDKDLLVLNPFRNIPILNAKDFLSLKDNHWFL